jgi:hypothetical protein
MTMQYDKIKNRFKFYRVYPFVDLIWYADDKLSNLIGLEPSP